MSDDRRVVSSVPAYCIEIVEWPVCFKVGSVRDHCLDYHQEVGRKLVQHCEVGGRKKRWEVVQPLLAWLEVVVSRSHHTRHMSRHP